MAFQCSRLYRRDAPSDLLSHLLRKRKQVPCMEQPRSAYSVVIVPRMSRSIAAR